MVRKKISLDIIEKNTLQKGGFSRPQVDGLHKKIKNSKIVSKIKTEQEDKNQKIIPELGADNTDVDYNKRLFMKVAGVAGLGLAASTLLPKSAEAYVTGSTPTSNVVGSKDASNNRINPAKEDGNLATIAGKDFATQTTLAAMKAKTDQLTFDGSNNLLTASSGGASVVGLKDSDDVRINPATDDSVILLRRILKQVDSLGVVDSAQRQKVTVEGATITSGTITTVSTVSTVTSATNLVALGGVDGRYLYIDTARNASANGIRSNLLFS